MHSEERIKVALEETEVLRPPKSLLATYRSSTLHYYVLAEPAYLEVMENEGPETKIREGEVTWEQPKLFTPGYILGLENFSDEAQGAFRLLASRYPDLAGLLYQMRYRKEYARTTTVSTSIEETAMKISQGLEDEDGPLTTIIKGVDELWDVSLIKFIQDLIVKSALHSQLPDYRRQGLVTVDEGTGYHMVSQSGGVPVVARRVIEDMFDQVKKGELEAKVLKKELDRWGLFKQYEDRFFDLFRKNS